MPTGECRIELREWPEQSTEISPRDTDARVAHREHHIAVAALELQTHLADIRELHRVAREIDENLTDLVDVARQANRGVRNTEVQGQLFLTRVRLDDCGCGAYEIGGEEIRCANRLASVLETREGEELLDHRREMLRHRTHTLEHVELALRQRTDHLIYEQLLIPRERREGRPQLVRYRREKSVLRAIGSLCLVEQLGFPQRERGVVGDRSQTMRVARRKWWRPDFARHRQHAENDIVRDEGREQHGTDSEIGDHLRQRT